MTVMFIGSDNCRFLIIKTYAGYLGIENESLQTLKNLPMRFKPEKYDRQIQ